MGSTLSPHFPDPWFKSLPDLKWRSEQSVPELEGSEPVCNGLLQPVNLRNGPVGPVSL